jgi:hypothetical protein
MSLINDALKRAKQAQDQAGPPTPPPLQFRPAEPAPAANRGPGVMLYVVVALVVVILLAGAWYAMHSRSQKPGGSEVVKPVAAANTTPGSRMPDPSASAPAPTPAQVAPPIEPKPAGTPSPATPAPVQASAPVKAVSESPVAATTPTVASAPNPASVPIPAATAPPTPPPPPPLPRLQAIVFHPTRPSAIISGKTVFVGDKVGELRVAAIERDSVTLSGGGKTNVLNLPE